MSKIGGILNKKFFPIKYDDYIIFLTYWSEFYNIIAKTQIEPIFDAWNQIFTLLQVNSK